MSPGPVLPPGGPPSLPGSARLDDPGARATVAHANAPSALARLPDIHCDAAARRGLIGRTDRRRAVARLGQAPPWRSPVLELVDERGEDGREPVRVNRALRQPLGHDERVSPAHETIVFEPQPAAVADEQRSVRPLRGAPAQPHPDAALALLELDTGFHVTLARLLADPGPDAPRSPTEQRVHDRERVPPVVDEDSPE